MHYCKPFVLTDCKFVILKKFSPFKMNIKEKLVIYVNFSLNSIIWRPKKHCKQIHGLPGISKLHGWSETNYMNSLGSSNYINGQRSPFASIVIDIKIACMVRYLQITWMVRDLIISMKVRDL